MGAGASGHHGKSLPCGISGGRNITYKYEAVKKQLDGTYDLNKMLEKHGYEKANGLYGANKKAKKHELIDTPKYKKYGAINHGANLGKHEW
jgi:hypothetical protein